MLILNQKILLALYDIANNGGFLQNSIYWIADRLDIWVIVVLILWFLYRAWKKQKTSGRLICFSCFHEVIMVIITGGISWGIAGLVKILVNTARPFAVQALEIVPLFVPGDPWGFPSGHTALFMALGIISWFHDRTVGTLVIIVAMCIGVARVMAGVHFPLDILGGAIIAGIVVSSIMFFDNQHLHHIA